jgi:hypothetical protein
VIRADVLKVSKGQRKKVSSERISNGFCKGMLCPMNLNHYDTSAFMKVNVDACNNQHHVCVNKITAIVSRPRPLNRNESIY